MSNRVCAACTILVLLILNAYPLYQMATTGGYLFYQNGFDEPGYLNYQMAGEYVSISRVTQIGERLVLLGHKVGLSGGWINFLLDLSSIAAFVFLARQALRQCGFDERESNLFALLVTILPIVFLVQTPIGTELLNRYMASDLIRWLATPSQTNFLPIVRTPEPQVSFVILGLAVWVALKLRSFVPVFAGLPLLYPFIAIPSLFILLSVLFRSRFPRMGKNPAVPLLLSFAIVSTLLSVYFRFFVGQTVKEAMAHLHSPLLSATGVVSVSAFAMLHNRIRVEHRYFALAVALAPLAAVNQQIISGWTAQPYNFELYFGLASLSLVLIFALRCCRRIALGLAAISMAALAYSQIDPYGAFQFHFNYETNRSMTLNAELVSALRSDPGHVAISNLNLASAASLIFPRQAATALAYQRTIGTSAVKQNYADYLCLRRAVLDSRFADEFRPACTVLDHAFRYQGLDYALLHLGRRKNFDVKNELAERPAKCPPARYLLVTADGKTSELRPGGPVP